MIHEGKWAKVIYCKQAKTLAPVPAITQSPLLGKVHPVKALQHETVAEVTTLKPEGSVLVQPQAVVGLSVREEQMRTKAIHCKDVKKDITLKTLFHGWKE